MSETLGEIKSLLESLLKRGEAGQLATDKHVEAQLAFNEQVSSDLAHLRKQVNLTQSHVDKVSQHRDQSKPIAPPPTRHQPHASTAAPPKHPFVCLANAGPPLIRMRPTASLFGAAHPCAQQEAYQEEQRDTYTVKPPKHDFAKFDSSAPYLWIDRIRYTVISNHWEAVLQGQGTLIAIFPAITVALDRRGYSFPVREVVRTDAMGAAFPSKPMPLYATIWDDSSSATLDGRYRANYKYAPFVAEFGNLVLHGGPVNRIDHFVVAACLTPWYEPVANAFSGEQRASMSVFRHGHMSYSYCHDPCQYAVTLSEGDVIVLPPEVQLIGMFSCSSKILSSACATWRLRLIADGDEVGVTAVHRAALSWSTCSSVTAAVQFCRAPV
ncbi:hypothetical protein ZWY2020_048215 [Hordeum vulgare]|nr:hypothetical protein ZWY2020_048215 [Hordeum vulgare]